MLVLGPCHTPASRLRSRFPDPASKTFVTVQPALYRLAGRALTLIIDVGIGPWHTRDRRINSSGIRALTRAYLHRCNQSFGLLTATVMRHLREIVCPRMPCHSGEASIEVRQLPASVRPRAPIWARHSIVDCPGIPQWLPRSLHRFEVQL